MPQEKHATVEISMVDCVEAMKKERNEAVKNLRAAVEEANMYKDCLEGKFGLATCCEAASKGLSSSKPSSSSSDSKLKLCLPCGKLYASLP